MAETTMLRNAAGARTAPSIENSPPHGQVKTGSLPSVQVKGVPVGPLVRDGQQKPVAIVPSKDLKGVAAGGLPMVQVKQTQNGPQIDDGLHNPVVIMPPKDQKTVATGGLPMVDVKMGPTGPQVQNMPTVQAARSPIQGAPPAMSQPRGFAAPQTMAQLPQAPHVRTVAPQMHSTPAAWGQGRVARVPAPQPAPQVLLPEVPDLSIDQLMLCRHAIEKYLGDVSQTPAVISEGAEPSAEASAESPSGNGLLAAQTLEALDQVMVAIAVRAEAMANAVAAAEVAAAAPTHTHTPAPAARGYVAAGGYVADRRPVGNQITLPTTAIARTAPSTSYVQPRAGAVQHAASGRAHGNAALAPRGVPRSGPLPTVVVKMNGGKAMVQNQAEVNEARMAQRAAAATPPAEAPMPMDMFVPPDDGAQQG